LGTGENVGSLLFNSPTVGYGGELQPSDHVTRMYKYAGNPLVGLLAGLELDAQVTLSPNPTSDFLNVHLEVAEPAEFVLMLHDAQGRLMIQKNLDPATIINTQLDLGPFPAGTYTLSISSEKGGLDPDYF